MTPQLSKLHALRIALNHPQTEVEAGGNMLFASRAGLAVVRAAFELFECDGLFDLARDVEREIEAGRRCAQPALAASRSSQSSLSRPYGLRSGAGER